MKILWVKANKLLPVDTGGKIRSLNLLRQLASRHQVTLLSYYTGRRDPQYERDIVDLLPGTMPVFTGIRDATFFERAMQYVWRFPSSEPFAISKFGSRTVRRLVSQLIAERRFDVAVCDFIMPARNFPEKLETPSVLFEHNVEATLWRRRADAEHHPIKRFAYGIEARRMERFERRAVGRFHRIIAVSENDRTELAEFTDPARIFVVPTGVDLQQFGTIADVEPKQPLVVFLGSMDWEPNIGGVEWFCGEVWNRVRAAVPDARMRIVGRMPHARVKRLADSTVEVTGAVPSVLDHLREAAVFVVPLLVGGGTRLKIFEGMAAGRAIVSTSLGAEGLEVTHGENILLADDNASFAAEVIRVLTNPALRRRLGSAAAALAARHDWSAVAGQLETALAEVASESLPTPAPKAMSDRQTNVSPLIRDDSSPTVA
jgi:glycosyltransferase involved in cell wall biosynthesis